jgi:hypothetical protein
MKRLRRGAAVAAGLVAVLGGLAGTSRAQDKLAVGEAETIRSLLERQVGKRLQGREFFDAVVALDRISAVLVRARAR